MDQQLAGTHFVCGDTTFIQKPGPHSSGGPKSLNLYQIL